MPGPATPDARSRRLGWAAVLGGVLVFTAASAAGNWTRYSMLQSTWSLDLGAFHNEAFNLALGRDITYLWITSWFKRGDHEGPSIYRSNQFSPLRLVVLPQIYRLHPRIETLMAIQGMLVGLGAAALYGMAVERAGSVALGLLLSATYLLHPATLNLAMNDYRDTALGLGPALVALWMHARRRYTAFVVAALVTLSARSEYALLVAAFGLMNARVLGPGPRRAAVLVPLVLAIAWAAACQAYYVFFYGVSWPVIGFATEGSLTAVAAELARRVVPFFELMLLPAVVGLGAPEAMVVALPYVALAKRVHGLEFPPDHLQHLSPALAAAFWAFALASLRWWPRLGRLRRAAGATLLAAALAGAAWFTVSALKAYPLSDVAFFAEHRRFSEEVPPDGTVVVPDLLTAMFSRHARLISYERLPIGPERPNDEEYSAALRAVLEAADLVVTMREPLLNQTVVATGRFEVRRVYPRFRVFVRRADVPRAERQDEVLQRALRWNELSARKCRGATLAVDDGRCS
jgi:hypothetical protein